jgi:hypothetical protein
MGANQERRPQKMLRQSRNPEPSSLSTTFWFLSPVFCLLPKHLNNQSILSAPSALSAVQSRFCKTNPIHRASIIVSHRASCLFYYDFFLFESSCPCAQGIRGNNQKTQNKPNFRIGSFSPPYSRAYLSRGDEAPKQTQCQNRQSYQAPSSIEHPASSIEYQLCKTNPISK